MNSFLSEQVSREYQDYRQFYGMSHRDAVLRIYKRHGLWVDDKIQHVVEAELEHKEAMLRQAKEQEEQKRKTALVEAKNQAAVMEAKKYILMKAEQKEVEFLTQKELDAILENPPLYDIEEFLNAADVLRGLGNQMLWKRGQAMLAKIEIQNPKPKEKAWTLPQEQ